MRTVPLGHTGVEVSALCLGAMYFGTRNDRASSFALLDQYVSAGGTFIDTANIYAHWVEGFQGGESETLLGEWMRERGNRPAVPRQQGRVRAAGRRARPACGPDRGRVREKPAPPRRRDDRPLLRARGRPDHAPGGDAGGVRPVGPGGQGALHRREQLPGVAARTGPPHQRGARLAGILLRPAALHLSAPQARRQHRPAGRRQR